METSQENAYTPTYLSVPKLETLIDKITKLSIKKVDKTTLQTFGFVGSDLSLGSITLKFLGLTNENDEVNTDTANLLRSMDPQKRKDGVAEIVKRSYSKLFEVRPDISTATREEIAESIRVTYQVSNRIATGAAPAFMYLCTLAGMRKEDEELQRRKSTSRKRSQSPKVKETQKTDGATAPEVIFDGNAKKRVLEGVGWRVVVVSDFNLDKNVRSSLLELEDSLEQLSQANTQNEEAKETEE